MIRLRLILILIIVGILAPSWFLLIALFISGFFFKNFWEAILIMTVLNSIYVYSGASFQAEYIVWGIVVFLFSWFIHTRTRFKKMDIS